MSGSTTKRNGKRDSFRSRKRFHRSTFVPGGSKEDPLNIETQLSETCQNGIIEEIEKPCERPIKKKKYDQDNHEKNKKCHSPTKRGDHGSPRRHEKKHPNKQEQEAAENRKAKKEYFNKKYRFGNFDRYYGIRLNPGENDKRLTVFQKEWFEKKSILDIGCNVGFLTLSIAKEFSPRRILGIDIDDHLIGVARKNIRHYCDHEIPMIGKYPASFASTFGPVTPAVTEPRSFSTKFPDNVWFKKENYILESDDLLELVEEEFDVILALSITKWIHLNWGDDGMRRFLQRAFKHLMPGGKLIIEPQPFESYRKRAKMMDELMGNYEKIEFKPDDFEMYLLEEIGFETVDHLGAPSAKSKGFERYIDVYTKPLKTDKNEGQKKS